MMATLCDRELREVRIGTFNWRNLKRLDWMLSLLVLSLAAVGFIVLYTASRGVDSPTPYWVKQAMFFVLGAGIALTIVCIDSRFLVAVAPLAYVLAVGLLVAVIVAGKEVKGGQRWLPMGPFRLQPSEEAKIVVVYALTWYLAWIKERIRNIFLLAIGLGIAAAPAFLVLIQPNLGTAVVFGPVAVVMVYVAGCKWWHLVVLFVAALALVPAAYPHLKEHQKARIDTFLNPGADPQDNDWQTRQSKITVGSGGFSGKGFGQGTQTMLNYLPEHHTDFIFSVWAEERGFVGGLIVLGLFSVFFLRGMKLALTSSDMTGALLASGAITILAFHTFVNIAITIGLLPVTGIPLPFLSYGGNFYLTTMICVGMLLNVPVRRPSGDRPPSPAARRREKT